MPHPTNERLNIEDCRDTTTIRGQTTNCGGKWLVVGRVRSTSESYIRVNFKKSGSDVLLAVQTNSLSQENENRATTLNSFWCAG